jgi:hypothetical protein
MWGLRDQLTQQFQPLRHQFDSEKHHARNVALWAVEAGNKAFTNGVRSDNEDDWNRRGCRPCRPCHEQAAGGRYYGHLPLHQFNCQRRYSITSTLGPAIVDADVAVLDIADFAQAPPERGNEVRELTGRFHAEKPNHRHRRLLRARCERPSCR